MLGPWLNLREELGQLSQRLPLHSLRRYPPPRGGTKQRQTEAPIFTKPPGMKHATLNQRLGSFTGREIILYPMQRCLPRKGTTQQLQWIEQVMVIHLITTDAMLRDC